MPIEVFGWNNPALKPGERGFYDRRPSKSLISGKREPMRHYWNGRRWQISIADRKRFCPQAGFEWRLTRKPPETERVRSAPVEACAPTTHAAAAMLSLTSHFWGRPL